MSQLRSTGEATGTTAQTRAHEEKCCIFVLERIRKPQNRQAEILIFQLPGQPKVCKMMAMMVVIMVLGLLCYIRLGFR